MDSQYPLTLGSSVTHWINARSSIGKITSDVFNSTIESLVSNDSNARLFTRTSSNKQFWSGSSNIDDGWFFNGTLTGGYTNSQRPDTLYLHNGNDFELWFDVYLKAIGAGTIVLLSTCASNKANIGIRVLIDNSGSGGASNAIRLEVYRGSSYTIQRVINNAVNFGAWHSIRIKRSGTSYSIDVNGVNKDTATQSNTPNISASTLDPVILSAGTNTQFLCRHFIAINRTLTTDEASSMVTYFNEGNKVPGTGKEIRIVSLLGQSNMQGSTYANTPPAYATGQFGAFLIPSLPSTIKLLQYGVNNGGADSGAFGPELEYGYQMNLKYPGGIIIYKQGVGGTSMYADWKIGGPQATTAILRAGQNLDKDFYQYRLNRKVYHLGIRWRQGEADAFTNNPLAPDSIAIQDAYTTQFRGLVQAHYNAVNLAWVDMSKYQVGVSLMNYQGDTSRPYNDQINNALTQVSSEFNGFAFSMSDYATADGTHFASDGQIAQGFRFSENALD